MEFSSVAGSLVSYGHVAAITLFKICPHVGRDGQRIWCPGSASAVLDLGKAAKPYLSSQPSPITS